MMHRTCTVQANFDYTGERQCGARLRVAMACSALTTAMFANSPAKWAEMWAETGSDWVYTPVWLPQLPMSIGTVLLAVAIWDYLTRLLVFRETQIHGEILE